jgi:hypothetical protein
LASWPDVFRSLFQLRQVLRDLAWRVGIQISQEIAQRDLSLEGREALKVTSQLLGP